MIDALNGKQNALLQSPTGTGKTMCLLSATLAWIFQNKNESVPMKKIFYASRTLSQIKQVPDLYELFLKLRFMNSSKSLVIDLLRVIYVLEIAVVLNSKKKLRNLL